MISWGIISITWTWEFEVAQETNRMFTGLYLYLRQGCFLLPSLLVSQPFHCLKSGFIQNAAHSSCFIPFTWLHISRLTRFCDVCFELCSVSSLSHLLPNPNHHIFKFSCPNGTLKLDSAPSPASPWIIFPNTMSNWQWLWFERIYARLHKGLWWFPSVARACQSPNLDYIVTDVLWLSVATESIS